MTRAEELAKELFPDPKLEDYDDILVYRADRDSASMGRIKGIRIYEQAEKDLGWHPASEHPPVDEEVIVLTEVIYDGQKVGANWISFGHIVNTDTTVEIQGKPYKVESYNGWNIPGVCWWMPMPKIPNEK